MADYENNNEMNNMEDDEDQLIELIDEEGNSTLFEHLATIEYQGEPYLVLTTPQNDVESSDDEAEEMDIHILKIEQDEQGNDVYVTPDEDVMEEVFNEFLRLIDEEEE